MIFHKLGRLLLHAEDSSGSGSSHPQATPQQFLDMYSKALPQLLSSTTSQTGGITTSLANSAAGANPIYTQSGLDQLNKYAPGYQQAGANLERAQAGTTAGLLTGEGGRAASNAVALNSALNPAQAAANRNTVDLANSINLNGLSPGESNAVERSLNQSNASTGNLGLSNGTNTVANAMNFGGAFNNKLGIASNIINSANSTAAGQNAQINPTQFAVQSGQSANNFGLGKFDSSQANANLTVPYSFSSALGNQLASVSSAQVTRNNNSSSGGGVCFLTTACCEHKGLPDDCEQLTVLRSFRDNHVPRKLVHEYYQKAPAIVKRISGDKKVLDCIFDTVQKCVVAIRSNKHKEALDLYTNMVKELE